MIVRGKSELILKDYKKVHTYTYESFTCFVLAVLQKSSFWGKVSTWYFLWHPFSGVISLERASKFEVIDSTIPDWWITRDFKRNICFDPDDQFSGEGGIELCHYQGPAEIIEDKNVLLGLANRDYWATNYCKSIYQRYEGLDIEIAAMSPPLAGD